MMQVDERISFSLKEQRKPSKLPKWTGGFLVSPSIMVGDDEQSLLLSLVFGWVDGNTLSTCCCVSRQWLGVAKQEHLWKEICNVHWPSSGTDSGISVIRAVGGYQKYYALRFQAQKHISVPRRRMSEPRLGMQDFVMFVDVVYDGTSICSLIKGGEALEPLYLAPSAKNSMFRFGEDFPATTTSAPFPSSSLTPKQSSPALIRKDCKEWRKDQVKDFQITWAVMEKKTHKMVQLLQARKGTMVGYTCTFKGCLPGHSCSPSGGNSHIVEVDIICRCSPPHQQHQRGQNDREHEVSMMILHQLKFGFMIFPEWRYFTQLQACRYLQHIFNHEM